MLLHSTEFNTVNVLTFQTYNNRKLHSNKNNYDGYDTNRWSLNWIEFVKTVMKGQKKVGFTYFAIEL